MSWPASHSHRKTGIVLNYLSLVLLAFSIMAIEYGWATGWPIAGIVIGLVLFTLTFVQIYGRTGLWKFVHMSLEELDEREAQIIHHSLHYFVLLYLRPRIPGLAAPLSFTVEVFATYWLCVFAVFIYLSHILPASIIAWSERNVLL